MPSLDSLKKNIKFEFYEREGNLFEEFVLNIYRLTHPDIRAVKPQGQKGDGANDGYISGELVLQVYAPEELKNKAIEKIEHDFERAKKYGWNYTDWHFVVNDKFKGVYPDIHQKLDELKANNPTLVLKIIDTQTLMDMIVAQLPTNRLRVHVLIGSGKDISEFGDFDAVVQVVDFISKEQGIRSFKDQNFKNFSKEKFKPDGIAKLDINITDEKFYPIFGAYLEKSKEVVQEYIDQIGLDIFGDIGKYITDMYTKYEKNFIPEIALIKTFEEIDSKLEDDRNLQTATWVVIAYFFDICDIGKIE